MSILKKINFMSFEAYAVEQTEETFAPNGSD